jgi:hypothetical protein
MPHHTARRDHAAAGEADVLTSPRPPHCNASQSPTLRYWRYWRYWRDVGSGSRSFRLGGRVLYRRGDLHVWSEVHGHHDGPDAA